MNSSKFALRAAISLALGLGVHARVAAGAETAAVSAEPALEEIVITAQKRTEKLEDVAVAASVVSSDELLKQNAGDISDLNRLVPSVQLNGTINGRVPLGVRGISSVSNEGTVGLSSGVAIMIDGVPIPSDSRAGNALEDVQSIEVLKGPQATLGGRTAATGIINIVTRQPTDSWSGNFNVSATTDNEYRVNAFISGPLVDKLDFSLAGYYTTRQFPITNIQLDDKTDEKVQGVRGKLLIRPNDDLDIRLSARVGEDNSQGMNFVYTHVTPGIQLLTGAGGPPWYPSQSQLLGGITPSLTNLQYSSPVRAFSDVRDADGSIDVQYRLGGLTLASTTAYQDEKQTNEQDLFEVSDYFWNVLTQGGPGCGNACPPPFNNTQTQHEDIKQFSEELKLVSPVDQPFSYVVGLFYSDSKVIYSEFRGLLPALQNDAVTPDTKTTDLYGRLTWKFTDDDALVTGLRYNYDQISYSENETAYAVSFPPPVIVGPLSASASNSGSTVVGDISLQHHFAPHSMAYLTYARGYSPAAYNTAQALTPTEPVLGQAKKENINHFELGSKGTYLDNRVELNVALFDTKYQDFQVQVYDQQNSSINPPLILANAGGAETRGLELDTAFAATDYLRLDFNAAYIDAKFTDYAGAPCYYSTSAAGIGYNPAGCYQAVNGVEVAGPGQLSVKNKAGNTIPIVQNLDGVTMPNSPKFKFTVSADQRIPLPGPVDIALNANYTWTARRQMLVDQNPYGFQDAYGILNLSAGVQDKGGHWSVTAFVNNVFNKVYYTDIEDFWSSPWGGTSTVVGQPARDAQVYGGIRANYKF